MFSMKVTLKDGRNEPRERVEDRPPAKTSTFSATSRTKAIIFIGHGKIILGNHGAPKIKFPIQILNDGSCRRNIGFCAALVGRTTHTQADRVH